jgi:hypothetical protein
VYSRATETDFYVLAKRESTYSFAWTVGGGLYQSNPVDPQLETAWFSTLEPAP